MFSVKVVSGRTRSLVERFERGEKITHTEEADNTNAVEQDPDKTSRQTGEAPVVVSTRRARSTPARVMPIVLNMKSDEPPSTQPARTSSVPVILNQSTNDEPSVSLTQSRTSPARTLPLTLNQATHIVLSRRPRRTSSARVRPMSLSQAVSMTSHECSVTSTRPDRTSPARVTQMLATPPTEIDQVADMAQDETHLSSQTDSDITENLMQTHEEFLSTLQSRLTKLQVKHSCFCSFLWLLFTTVFDFFTNMQIVRHFWERSDVKGAIGALRKLTDQSVSISDS